MKEFALGVCSDDMGHTENIYGGTIGNFKTTEFPSLSSLLKVQRKGGADPKCNQ